MSEYSYTIPVLENNDGVCFWSYSDSSDENSGNTAHQPKKSIGSVAESIRDGGTVIISGKGYIGTSVSLLFNNVVKFSAVSPDGRDFREEKSEYGAVMWEGGETLCIYSDVIFDRV
ncbi:MAG: hypothetical protein IJE84_00105, partial [Clostridia bacterium]|nr:hypothetical protein [Clostridia bacterium]